jgi:hypothetical protein
MLLFLWWISFGCGCCTTVSPFSRSWLKCSRNPTEHCQFLVLDVPTHYEAFLWLTILPGTVITSFPSSWDQKQSYGLKKRLDEEIKTNKKRDPITSVDQLVHLIIKLSVDFLRQDGPSRIKFQEAFLSSINNIVSNLHENQKSKRGLQHSKPSVRQSSSNHSKTS